MSLPTSSSVLLSLEDYVREILEPNGFNELDLTAQEKLLTEFVDQALIRIAVGLSPHLSAEAKQRFEKLVDDEHTTEQTWVAFWQQEVPDSTEHIRKILDAYAEEIRSGFSS